MTTELGDFMFDIISIFVSWKMYCDDSQRNLLLFCLKEQKIFQSKDGFMRKRRLSVLEYLNIYKSI